MADQTITQTTSSIPDWAQSYFTGDKGIFSQAQALAETEYKPYTDQRIADFSGLTTQAIKGAGAMAPSGFTTLGGGIAGSAALNAGNMNYQGFQPGQFTGQAASQYMNPFMQNVVDIQQREAQRQADIAGTQRGAQAVKAGAFGGSRQAIMDAEAQRNLALQMGDIQAQGLNQAFTQAQNQFNTEQQLAEQARQYGAGLGLQGLQTAIQGAGQLGTLGQQSFTQGMDINKLQGQYGAQQQALEQSKLDRDYQDFLTQKQYPYQQLGFYTDILGTGLRGASGVTSEASQIYAPPPSTISQLAGLGTAAIGLGGLFTNKAKGGSVGYAEGGSVGGYATGGISGLNPMELDAATDRMSDQQMQGVMGLASVTDLAKLQIAQKLAQNNMIRQAAQQAQAAAQPQPQGTIADEALAEMGIGGLDVPDETFSAAGGGIVAFGVGGTTLRDVESRAGIPYGTESEFEKRRKKLEKEAEARRIREKEAADRAKEDKMLPNGGKSDTVLPTTPTTAAIPAAPQLPKELQTVGGIAGLMTNPEIEANRATADTMSEDAARGDVIAAQQAEEQYIKDQAALGVRGKEREESLRAQQDELKGKEDKNFNMALIEAGLAMMSGNSANAFENIGKGALVGTKAFKEGEEKLQARKDKLNEALYALEDARYSDKKVDAETLRGLKRDVANAKTNVQKVMAANFRNTKVDAPAGVLKSAVETYSANTMAVYGQDSANRRQAMSDKAAMDRVEAGKTGLTKEAELLLQEGNKIAQMPEGPEKAAAEAALQKRVDRLTAVSSAQYAAAGAQESKLYAAADAAIDKRFAMQYFLLDKMPDGPERDKAKAILDARVAEAKRLKRIELSNAGAGGAGGAGGASGAGAVPQQAIDALKKNPALAAQFDAKYGVGASAKYLGR